MAIGNRTETKSAATSALVPTLTLAQHLTLMNDSVLESALFRKDIIASETPGAGVVAIDYSDKDTATVTTAVNLSVSFTNIENGDVKYLAITKGLTDTVSFTGATDTTNFPDYIDNYLTVVLYQVYNKNGIIYVNAIANTIKGLTSDTSGNVSFSENVEIPKILKLTGNSNTQGLAQNIRFAKQYPVVSLGTKLIIPFISQNSLLSTTFVRIIGHSARFNNNFPLGFTADFAVGHLTTLTNLGVISRAGNCSSVDINGLSIEMSFTTDYTSATADGIFITIEYMTNNILYSIDVANIAMN